MGRKPFLDNTKLILIGIVALIAALAGFLVLANRASAVAPDVLAEFVLYALFATNDDAAGAAVRAGAQCHQACRRAAKGDPFARFRTRLVMALLGMTLIPAVLVLIVGSELIRNNIDRFFNAPMATMLSSARDLASDYYRERQRVIASVSQRLARRLALWIWLRRARRHGKSSLPTWRRNGSISSRFTGSVQRDSSSCRRFSK